MGVVAAFERSSAMKCLPSPSCPFAPVLKANTPGRRPQVRNGQRAAPALREVQRVGPTSRDAPLFTRSVHSGLSRYQATVARRPDAKATFGDQPRALRALE